MILVVDHTLRTVSQRDAEQLIPKLLTPRIVRIPLQKGCDSNDFDII